MPRIKDRTDRGGSAIVERGDCAKEIHGRHESLSVLHHRGEILPKDQHLLILNCNRYLEDFLRSTELTKSVLIAAYDLMPPVGLLLSVGAFSRIFFRLGLVPEHAGDHGGSKKRTCADRLGREWGRHIRRRNARCVAAVGAARDGH